MKTNRIYIAVVVILLFLMGGCASKKYARLASKFEESGMYQLAVENYLTSLDRKSTNNEKALIGLMRSSKRYSDELAEKIDGAYNGGNDTEVVRLFMQLKKLQNNTEAFKVELGISSKTQGQFKDASSRYLKQLYFQAQELLDNERFEEAAEKYKNILQVDNNYERSAELYKFAICEPLYRLALQQINTKKFRSAYKSLSTLLTTDANFKDALSLQQEALNNAILTIAIKPTASKYTQPETYSYLNSEIKTAFEKNKNVFLRLVSTDHTQAMLNEQKKALENNLSLSAGNILPVRAYLTFNIISSNYYTTPLKRKEQKAFLREKDRNNGYKFTKVYYYEYEKACTAYFHLNYEYVLVENSAIICSNTIERSYTDQIHYAYSEYDSRDLFPGDWGYGIKDTIYTDNARLSRMKNLLNARKVLTSEYEFQQNIAKLAASDMVKNISNYDPEK